MGLPQGQIKHGQQPEEEDEHRVSDAKTLAQALIHTRISESIEGIIAQLVLLPMDFTPLLGKLTVSDA